MRVLSRCNPRFGASYMHPVSNHVQLAPFIACSVDYRVPTSHSISGIFNFKVFFFVLTVMNFIVLTHGLLDTDDDDDYC